MTASIVGFPAMDVQTAERLYELARKSTYQSGELNNLLENLQHAVDDVREQNSRMRNALLRVLEHHPPGSPMAAAIGEALK